MLGIGVVPQTAGLAWLILGAELAPEVYDPNSQYLEGSDFSYSRTMEIYGE
jgi:hypothetical protein